MATILTLDSKITFGKHKWERLGDVIVSDPNWVRWATINVEWFKIDSEARAQLDVSELGKADRLGPYEEDDYEDGGHDDSDFFTSHSDYHDFGDSD